jgi:hypothetical protein
MVTVEALMIAIASNPHYIEDLNWEKMAVTLFESC